LNDAILIDFGVKDEPSEVKSESLETFTWNKFSNLTVY
jgi:hypothetical protein